MFTFTKGGSQTRWDRRNSANPSISPPFLAFLLRQSAQLRIRAAQKCFKVAFGGPEVASGLVWDIFEFFDLFFLGFEPHYITVTCDPSYQMRLKIEGLVDSAIASHAGVFRGARLSSLPFVGRDEKRTPLKTPAWEANRTIARWRYLTTTTTIHFGFALLFKFVNPAEDYRTIALICIRKQQTQGFW